MKFNNPGSARQCPIPPCSSDEFEAAAWGVERYGEGFKRLTINRPKVGPSDVKMKMKFCGICHSDVHIALNEFNPVSG